MGTITYTLVLCVPLLVLAQPRLPAADGMVSWQGRVAYQSDGSVRYAWEGVQATFGVDNTNTVTMYAGSTYPSGDARYHIYVDGKLATNITIPPNTPGKDFTIAAGLDSSASHTITVWHLTDPITMAWPNILDNYQYISHFDVPSGDFNTGPTRKRNLLVIGDSITAGNQIDKVTCLPDHSNTYGAKLCEYFQANCTTTAISGAGLYENCCDNGPTMAIRSRLVFPAELNSVFNDTLYVPDAVLINLGTNDFGHDGGPAWEAAFTQTYVDFLHNLTEWHANPALPFFCGVGPITHSYTNAVNNAIAAAKSQYGINAVYVNYTTELDGCGHPGYVGHQQMFQIAQPIISYVMGWT